MKNILLLTFVFAINQTPNFTGVANRNYSKDHGNEDIGRQATHPPLLIWIGCVDMNYHHKVGSFVISYIGCWFKQLLQKIATTSLGFHTPLLDTHCLIFAILILLSVFKQALDANNTRLEWTSATLSLLFITLLQNFHLPYFANIIMCCWLKWEIF